MKLPLSILLSSLLVTATASAVTVENTAGQLSSTVTDKAITDLTVTGTLDAADFDFISSLDDLKTLDLSGARVESYIGTTVLTSVSNSDADVLPPYALMGLGSLTTVKFPAGLTAIGEGALASTGITSITIPSSVTTIGDGAFSGCQRLTSITVPSSVTDMGNHTFMGCGSLAKATVDADIDSLGSSAFARCTALSDVTLPQSVSLIGEKAFAGCSSLSSLTFPRSLETIAPSAFESSGLTELDLRQSVSLDSIGDWAFARCKSLVAVMLPDEVTRMGEGAFFEDTALETYTTPAAMTALPPYLLKGDNSIDPSALMPDGIASIGAYSLAGMDHIAAFSLPETLTYIGDNAFEGWTRLADLNGMELSDVPELGDNVWQGVDQSKATLTVKGDMASQFKATPQWQEFNITFTSASISPTVDSKVDVDARFSGYDLIITSSANILSASLYDSTGTRHAYVEPDDTSVTIDTSDLTTRLYIVKLDLDNGTQTSVKVARRNP
ncbi:MAG: leucine-rich repeat protein [Pseudoflavonifractor sp.]|nr:leucine-rich repeat protein [Pseudoflavonifractor sp.]